MMPSSRLIIASKARLRTWLAVGTGIGALVLLARVWPEAQPMAAALSSTAPDQEAAWQLKAAQGAAPSGQPISFQTGLENLPPSLAGTEVAGELKVGPSGQLIIQRGIRDLFDYFMSAQGEQPQDVILARIQAYIRHHLKAPANLTALALLDSYQHYKLDLDEAMATMKADSLEALKARLVAMDRLRSQHFSPEVVEAFFADDQAYDHYTVDKLSILADTSLSLPQRSAQLQKLRDALPASLRDNLGAMDQVQTLNEVTTQWREQGGSEAELRSIRTSLLGPAATDRLEALDREERAMTERMNTYMQARADILKDATLAQATRQQKIEDLRKNSFQGTEQIRAATLERIADSNPNAPAGTVMR